MPRSDGLLTVLLANGVNLGLSKMADACNGLLLHPPEIELLDPISAHDLN